MCCEIRRSRTHCPTALLSTKPTEWNPCSHAACCCRLTNPGTGLNHSSLTMLGKYLWLKANHISLCLSFRQRQSYIKPLSKSLEKRINHGEFSSQFGEWYRYYFEGTRPFSSFACARGTLSEVTLQHMMVFWLNGQPSVALSHRVKLWVTLKCQTDGHHCLRSHPFYMLPQLFVVRVMKLCVIIASPLTGTAYDSRNYAPPVVLIFFLEKSEDGNYGVTFPLDIPFSFD